MIRNSEMWKGLGVHSLIRLIFVARGHLGTLELKWTDWSLGSGIRFRRVI